jgi:fructose/tagatose bisphosphate aldolase
MPWESIPRLLARCRAGGYAVGYLESWNLESLPGVLDAAEQTRSPVLVGFNGEFLSGTGRLVPERLALYGALGKAAAESSSVPCGFIFNECPDDAWVLTALMAADAGLRWIQRRLA